MKLFKDYTLFIIQALLKPVTTFKAKLKKHDDLKTIAIFTAIVAAVAMLLNFVHQVIATVRVPQFEGGFFTGIEVVGHEWYWNNISELSIMNLIFRNFFIYLGVIAAIALVYFLAGRVVRKDAKFQGALLVATISAIPLVLTSFIVAPIFNWLHMHLAVIVAIAAIIYSYALLIVGMNQELDLAEDDTRVYVNVVCIALLLIIGYFIAYQMLDNLITLA